MADNHGFWKKCTNAVTFTVNTQMDTNLQRNKTNNLSTSKCKIWE